MSLAWLAPDTAAVLADAVLVLHAGIVAFVVLGLVAIVVGGLRGWAWVYGLRWRALHVLLMLFVALQAWLGQLCPLTIWEQALRAHAGEAVHAQGFIEHWLSRLIFFDLPPWVFVAAYTAFAALVVLAWWRVPPQRRA